jgi:hypothetical protein
MIGSNSQGVKLVCEARGRKGDGGAGAPRNSGVGKDDGHNNIENLLGFSQNHLWGGRAFLCF